MLWGCCLYVVCFIAVWSPFLASAQISPRLGSEDRGYLHYGSRLDWSMLPPLCRNINWNGKKTFGKIEIILSRSKYICRPPQMRPTCTLLLDSFLMGRGWVRADSHKTSPAAIHPSCHANSALNMVETVNNERRLRPQEHFLQVVLAPAQLMESWQWRARSSEIGRYCLDKYCVRLQILDRKLSLNLFDDSRAMGRREGPMSIIGAHK